MSAQSHATFQDCQRTRIVPRLTRSVSGIEQQAPDCSYRCALPGRTIIGCSVQTGEGAVIFRCITRLHRDFARPMAKFSYPGVYLAQERSPPITSMARTNMFPKRFAQSRKRRLVLGKTRDLFDVFALIRGIRDNSFDAVIRYQQIEQWRVRESYGNAGHCGFE